MQTVNVQDLGLMAYQAAWDYQTGLHQKLVDNKLKNRSLPPCSYPQDHHFLLVEHPPVFTLGKSGSPENLLLNREQLSEKNIEYFPINRGGDITFHGPGQIVGYPILDLECFFTDVHRYVRGLEETIIRTVAEYGIVAGRIGEYTGVWIDGPPAREIPEAERYFFSNRRKICAIGVHISRWVTLHGFAFNVNTDLAYFNLMVPCGITDTDKTVTSMARELGRAVDVSEVKSKLLHHFCTVFECNMH